MSIYINVSFITEDNINMDGVARGLFASSSWTEI